MNLSDKACSLFHFYGLLVWIEVLALIAFSFTTWAMYLARYYWPVWYSGAAEVASMQAAFSVMVWWLNDPLGLSAWLAWFCMGVSLYINISNLIQLDTPGGQCLSVYNGTTNFFNAYTVQATGNARGQNAFSTQWSFYLFLVIWQFIIFITSLFIIFFNKYPIEDADFSTFTHNGGRGNTQQRAFCCFDSVTEDRWSLNCFNDSCCRKTHPRIINYQYYFMTCFGVPNKPYADYTDGLRSLFAFCGVLFAFISLSESIVAAARHIAPWPSFDSPSAVAFIALIWSMYPVRYPGTIFKTNQLSLCGSAQNPHRLFLFTQCLLVLGSVMCFAQLGDNVINEGPGIYLLVGAANTSDVRNITVAGVTLSIISANNASDYQTLFAQYVLVTAMVPMVEACICLVVLWFSCMVQYDDDGEPKRRGTSVSTVDTLAWINEKRR